MRYWLVCMFLGSLAQGQGTSSTPALTAEKPAALAQDASQAGAVGQNQKANISNVAADTPIMTINGLCDNSPADKSSATSNCQTVITRAEFENVIQAVQPSMPARARREFALRYANALVMANRAEEMGLDTGPSFEEQMKIARIQVLSKELNKAIQEKVSQISDSAVEDYYKKNLINFESAEMDRIYVPKARQTLAPPGTESADSGPRDQSQELEQIMKEEADSLQKRAIAGEDFNKLQADACQFAGIKGPVPSTSIRIRRTSLPSNQVSIMDLKPGEISSVLADPSGYVIFKVKSKEIPPLDQVRAEIKATLRSQRSKDEMQDIKDSATPILDESYFLHNRPPQGVPRLANR
jgi:hypothetical protein